MVEPINLESIYTAPSLWFQNIQPVQQELFKQSLYLINDARTHHLVYFDYSYIVMPASKGFEGYIKDLLLHLGLISQTQCFGKKFRVGKALNPALVNHPRLKKEALYDDLSQLCGDRDVAQLLWETWKLCRNEVFHYYAETIEPLNLDDAQHRIQTILTAVRDSSLSCELSKHLILASD